MRLVVGFFLCVVLCGCGESAETRAVWTADDLARLTEAVKAQFPGPCDWSVIAAFVGTKSDVQCSNRWYYQHRMWTSDEDERLRIAVETRGTDNWEAVAGLVETKNSEQCSSHWYALCSRWSPAEDDLLIAAVRTFGTKDWGEVANHVGTRSRTQCRERWSNYHDPEIKNNAWTPEEETKLLQLSHEYGHKWKQFTTDFLGRSEYNIRNRYNAMQRRKIKPIPSRENVAAPGEEELLHDIASEEALLADVGAPGEEAFRYDIVDPEPWDLLDPLLNPMDSRNNKAPDSSDPFPWDFP